ncbi:uridine kinase [Deltaproteobacteria bacterium TL4]
MKIIAISGSSASGKSLFASYLAQRLPNSTVLPLDHFYLNRPDPVSMEQYNFDVPTAFDFKLFHHVFEELLSLKPVLIPTYDYRIGKRQKNTLKLVPGAYLILDGLYTLMHASIRSSLHYSFFLESPPDVTLGRRVLRDIQERQTTAEFSIHQYFTFVRPAYYSFVLPTKQYAHLVVENDYQSRLDLFLDDFLQRYQL